MLQKRDSLQSLWREWKQKSRNRQIFASIITVGTVTLVVKLVAIVKEILVAERFGTSDVLDAFLIALLIPTFGATVLAGSFKSAFIPTFIRTRGRVGPQQAQALLSLTLLVTLAVLVVLSGFLLVAAPHLLPRLGSGFDDTKLALTGQLFVVLVPLLLLLSTSEVFGAVLNAEGVFFWPAIAPLLMPLAVLTFLLLFFADWGIYSLVAGTLVGATGSLVLLASRVGRRSVSGLAKWREAYPDLVTVSLQMLPLLASFIAAAGIAFVDQAMAASLGRGSVAALSYASKVTSMILALAAGALGTATLPHLAQMVSESAWRSLEHTLRVYTRLVLAVSIPAALVLALFSEPLIKLVFERGAFVAADTLLVGRVQQFVVLQIPLYILVILFSRCLSALNASVIISFDAIMRLALNIVFNLILMRRLGVAGIALSSVVVLLLSSTVLGAAVFNKLRRARSALNQAPSPPGNPQIS